MENCKANGKVLEIVMDDYHAGATEQVDEMIKNLEIVKKVLELPDEFMDILSEDIKIELRRKLGVINE